MSVQVILASGYYAAFRVTLVAKALEGMYDGAIHVTTDYEVGGLSYHFNSIQKNTQPAFSLTLAQIVLSFRY